MPAMGRICQIRRCIAGKPAHKKSGHFARHPKAAEQAMRANAAEGLGPPAGVVPPRAAEGGKARQRLVSFSLGPAQVVRYASGLNIKPAPEH